MATIADKNIMTSRGTILLKEAARLNAEGLGCLLASQNTQGAYTSFRSGLTVINQYLADLSSSAEASVMEGDTTMDPWLAPNMIPGLKDEAFFVHAHAFGLTPSEERGLTASEGDMHVASLIILFNMALTFHQFGSLNGDKDKLTRACKLYETCARLALDVGVGGNHDILPSAIFIFCQNNQAHIVYRFLGNQGSALNLLASMAEKVNDLSTAMGGPMTRLFEDVMLNVIILSAAPLLGTPAA